MCVGIHSDRDLLLSFIQPTFFFFFFFFGWFCCINFDLLRKAYCSLCTDTVSYGSSSKKGLQALCSVLPPASNDCVLCYTATRTVLSVLSHTL